MSQRAAYRDTAIVMDTIVSVEVVTPQPATLVRPAIQRALGWFGLVEHVCSRFDPDSEVRQLLDHVGTPVVVGTVLFEAVRFALALAKTTAGVFDPTVGHLLEAKGFDRNYRTGERTPSQVPARGQASYRDVLVNPAR